MFGLSVGALNSVDLVLLFLFIWWCIAWWFVVFAGLDVLIIVVSLAVFFVGTIVVCGCLVLGWRCFGFGFGLCALVLGLF